MVRTSQILLALLAAATIIGCGESPSPRGQGGTVQGIASSGQAASEFPKASSTSLGELEQRNQESVILAPSVSVFEQGSNRYGFALFDPAQKQIAGAQVALYTASRNGSNLRGPFLARSESLAVAPQYTSKNSSQDVGSAKSVYVADVNFP